MRGARGAAACIGCEASASTDTAIIRSPLVHSVRVRYALGDDPRANLASYALVCEQWAHCCGVAPPDMAAGVAAGTAAPATAQPPAAAVPAPAPVRILQNLIDSRIEHAVYVATTATGCGASEPQPVAVFLCPPHVTPAARAALVAETMQALCDDPRTTRIADVRVTAERCKMIDEADALRPLVERVLLRVFL